MAHGSPIPPGNRPYGVSARHASVSRLKLTGYRNYEGLSVDFESRTVVLTGANGAGKTNLLEAISFLSPGRGLRRAGLGEVARRPGDGSWAVAATVERGDGSVDIGTGIAMTAAGPEKRRSIRIEHQPARAADQLLDYLKVIWLTPAMDGLFAGPAADRRRFLDRAVLAIDGRHGSRVNAFERAVRGRNRILAEPRINAGWADAIENEIAELGVAIAAARRDWCDLITALIEEEDDDGPFPAAGISLEGFLEAGLAGGSAPDLEEAYRSRLAAERGRDAAAGRTLTGAHRSDLAVRHVAKERAADACSTGEQKALLVGMVLAQAGLVMRRNGETPIVLLDEIAAHLDETRRMALFEILDQRGCQTFMTGTDAALFDVAGLPMQHVLVDEGTVRMP